MANDASKQELSSLDDFSNRLDAARGANETGENDSARRSRAMGKGFRLASELLAAMIVGPLLGLGVDHIFGSSPWGLLAGIFVGFATGVRNVAQSMKSSGADGHSPQNNQPEGRE